MLNKITFLKDFVGNFGALPSAVSCPSVKKTIVSFQMPRYECVIIFPISQYCIKSCVTSY